MLKLFQILLKKWHIAAVIVAFLAFSAYCELELPAITADIVNIGVQQSGIEVPVPEKITYERMARLLVIVNDPWQQEDILAQYRLQEGVYHLSLGLCDCMCISEGDLSEIERLLFEPLAIALFAENMTVESFDELTENAEIMAILQEFMGAASLRANIAQVRAMIERGNIDYEHSFVRILLQLVRSRIGEIDPVLVRQSAIMQTRNELIAAGVDVDSRRMDYIFSAGLKMLLFALGAASAAMAAAFWAANIAAFFAKQARRAVFEKVLSFSGKESDEFSTASLITRCTNDVSQVQTVLSFAARLLIFAPMMGLGAFMKVTGSETGANLGWIIGLAIGLILVIVIALFIIAVPRFNKIQPLIDKINLISRETLTGLPVIRAFAQEEHEKARFDSANADLMSVNIFINRLMLAMFPTMMLIMNMTSVLIIWVSAGYIDAGVMQIGDLMAFINYTMQIIMSFLMLTMMFVLLPRAVVSFRRIAEVLDTKAAVTDPAHPVRIPEGSQLEFRNVSFRYHNAQELALSDVSFCVETGETVAVIGTTGSGKSTLANLILRFFDPTEGRILINGTDIRVTSLKTLRDKIGYVPQKTVLMSGTVGSNIAFSDTGMDEPRILRAAEIAQAHELEITQDISQGGSNVSGGQKQRISIARALAKAADIYVFDDSFSALDYKTDSALRNALTSLKATKIIIAQRISTVMNADRIVVMQDGKVCAIGTHAELIESCETYAQIAHSQTGGAA
jgi:ATP-binding cassette subfamily B protein